MIFTTFGHPLHNLITQINKTPATYLTHKLPLQERGAFRYRCKGRGNTGE